MNIFTWLERKLFTGEVIKDYGCLSEEKVGGGRLRTSLLLCRRGGKLQLVFRHSAVAPFAASVNYSYVPAAAVPRLGEIIEDIGKTAQEHELTELFGRRPERKD